MPADSSLSPVLGERAVPCAPPFDYAQGSFNLLLVGWAISDLSSQVHHLQRLGVAHLDLKSSLPEGVQGLRRGIDESGFRGVLLQVVKLPELHRRILP